MRVHATPQPSALAVKSPRKLLRTASTTCLVGITLATFCSHSGPSVIGRRMPDSSSTGIITMLMIGAMTSSLFVVRASAFDDAAQAAPSSRVRAMPSTAPQNGASMPMRYPRPTRMRACTNSWRTSRHSRPMSSAVRLAGVTRSASMTPSRHSPMSEKPAKKAPKMPSCTSRPGTKKV